MNIVFICDLHGRTAGVDRLPPADLLILGGDLTAFGKPADVRAVLRAFLPLYPRTVAVLGNCDPPTGEAVLRAHAASLHLAPVRCGPAVFLGIGGSGTTPFGTPYEWVESAMEARLGAVPEPVPQPATVLVTHTPPLGSGADRLPSGRHVGSTAVAAFVRRLQPRLVLCGHIHEAIGEFRMDGIPVVNPGPFRAGRYALITLPDPGRPVRCELGSLD